jgi:hypothetical protein
VDHGPRISVGVVEHPEEVLAVGDAELVFGVSTACSEGGAAGFAAVVAMAQNVGEGRASELVLNATTETRAFD